MSNPGKSSLIGWWPLNETSGDRSDRHRGLTLTDNNTVTSATGKKGNAAVFTRANSEYLSRASESLLQVGDIDFTLGAWFKLTSKNSAYYISKYDSVTVGEYGFLFNAAFDRFRFITLESGGTISGVNADTLGSPSLDTWYFIVMWHDAAGNTVNIQANNGTVDSAATSNAPTTTSSGFKFGARYSTPELFLDGQMDEVFFYKRVLTSAERTWLYNSGTGRTYDELSSGQVMYY